jgi:hypothetical protein
VRRWLGTFWDCFFAAGLPDFYGVSLLQEQQSDRIGMGGCTVFGAGAICEDVVMVDGRRGYQIEFGDLARFKL